jgi:hypothetical protein
MAPTLDSRWIGGRQVRDGSDRDSMCLSIPSCTSTDVRRDWKGGNMKTYKPVVLMLAMCGALLLLAGRADSMEKRSTLSVSDKIRIPGQSLDPGTYVFKMEEPQETGQAGQRNIVRVVKDGEEANVIATCLAIPNDHLTPAGESGLLFWPVSGDSPKAVRAWFSPGDNFGYEFAYSESEAREIGMAAGEQVPTLTHEDESRIEAAITAAAQSASQTANHAQTEPEQSATTKDDKLPATASPLPILGLAGLMFLAAGLMFRAIRQHS